MSAPPATAALGLPPFDLLYEAPGLPAFDLPEALALAYGGSLGFTTPRLCANVTVSHEGTVASAGPLRPGESASRHARFLAGLLRACADAVLVGEDVGMRDLNTRLSAEDAYPPAASAYARLRRLRGRPPHPKPVMVLTGDPPPRTQPTFAGATLVLASKRRARSLREQLPVSTALIELTECSIEPSDVVDALQDRGYELILCEGCPAFVGSFLEAGVVDEIFLTHMQFRARRSARNRPDSQDGFRPLPFDRAARLLSLRRGDSLIFSRYELERPRASGHR